jgi:hypothetical protein
MPRPRFAPILSAMASMPPARGRPGRGAEAHAEAAEDSAGAGPPPRGTSAAAAVPSCLPLPPSPPIGRAAGRGSRRGSQITRRWHVFCIFSRFHILITGTQAQILPKTLPSTPSRVRKPASPAAARPDRRSGSFGRGGGSSPRAAGLGETPSDLNAGGGPLWQSVGGPP